MNVFSSYKPFLHVLSIYDSKNFHHKDPRILLRNICQAIAYSACIFAMAVFWICDLKQCFDYNFNMTRIVLPFGLLIGSAQLSITYISIRMKGDVFDEVIAKLQRIVTNREYFPPFVHLHPVSSSPLVIFTCILSYSCVFHRQDVNYPQSGHRTTNTWRKDWPFSLQSVSDVRFSSLCCVSRFQP